jgi:hypothetical protein
MAGDRARALTREIGGDAAATVAREAGGSGRAAAREAVRTTLAPTLEELRRSAFALLDRMLPTEPIAISEMSANAVGGDPLRRVTSRR